MLTAQIDSRTPVADIHGLGSKLLSIHQSVNWTFCCIALTNQQIDELSKNIKLGTFVFIG